MSAPQTLSGRRRRRTYVAEPDRERLVDLVDGPLSIAHLPRPKSDSGHRMACHTVPPFSTHLLTPTDSKETHRHSRLLRPKAYRLRVTL